jgi:tetratricopeptide (TPR) repeat protein
MAYSVGLVSQETRGRYMAGRSGIPCAFLVSPQKQVAWVGHPATVGPVLQQALDGRLDVERARRVEPLVKALTDALRSRNPALAAQAADALLAEEPAHLDGLRVRLALARQARDAAAARAAFARVDPAAVTPADAEAVAHILLGEADLAFCFVDLVSPLVARVSAAAPEAPSTLVLQARYAYALGRIEEAIACQEKAAAAEPGAMAVLEYYRKIRELRDTPRPADGK